MLLLLRRGIYLTDLTFIEDGNPDYISSLINFKKRELVYDVIREIEQYQQKGYDFPADNSIFNVLNNLQVITVQDFSLLLPSHARVFVVRSTVRVCGVCGVVQDEEKLWALSLQREPRNIERASDLP